MSVVSKVSVGVSIESATVDLRVECAEGGAFANVVMTPWYARGLAKELVAAAERADAIREEKKT